MQENQTALSSLGRELFSSAVYKRSQGRVTRQVTCGALLLAWGVAVWRLTQILPAWFSAGGPMTQATPSDDYGLVRFVVPLLVFLAGGWLAYRAVNLPRFAEFLIGVESEMAKVAWPTVGEVARSSAVVIFMIFALSFILAAYDLFWWFILRAIQGFR
jgi:preprotein translocase subunit SecE